MAEIDRSLLRALNGWTEAPWLDMLFAWLTDIGRSGIIWIALGILLLLGAGRLPGLRAASSGRWRAVALVMLLAALAGFGLDTGIKRLVERPRPPLAMSGLRVTSPMPDSFSFPSGHALSSFAAATVVVTAVRRSARRGQPLTHPADAWSLLVLAGAISVSRVYLGHHYPSDIAAGALLGILTGWGAWAGFEWLLDRSIPRQPHIDSKGNRVIN